MSLAERLIATLPTGVDGLYNPWRDQCEIDLPCNTSQAKLDRLAHHLDCDAKYILCGEAPGYQGCARSGIAFTSERLLMQGAIPRVPRLDQRLTKRDLPFSEPSATIVWKALYHLGIEQETILWNAVQMHPYRAGDMLTNRTPTPQEVALGEPGLKLLIEAFPSAKVIAVGKTAARLLEGMGVVVTAAVRHPANGGATAFSQGVKAVVRPESVRRD